MEEIFPNLRMEQLCLMPSLILKSHLAKPWYCSRDGPTVSNNTDVGYAIIINCVWTLCCSSQRFTMQKLHAINSGNTTMEDRF
jgi:hypothetical protein